MLGSLKRRAKIMVDALNKLEGISCQPTEGLLPVCRFANRSQTSGMMFLRQQYLLQIIQK